MHLAQLCGWLLREAAIRGFWRDVRAVTSIEYVIIAVVITVAIFGGLGLIGGSLTTIFGHVSSEL